MCVEKGGGVTKNQPTKTNQNNQRTNPENANQRTNQTKNAYATTHQNQPNQGRTNTQKSNHIKPTYQLINQSINHLTHRTTNHPTNQPATPPKTFQPPAHPDTQPPTNPRIHQPTQQTTKPNNISLTWSWVTILSSVFQGRPGVGDHLIPKRFAGSCRSLSPLRVRGKSRILSGSLGVPSGVPVVDIPRYIWKTAAAHQPPPPPPPPPSRGKGKHIKKFRYTAEKGGGCMSGRGCTLYSYMSVVV